MKWKYRLGVAVGVVLISAAPLLSQGPFPAQIQAAIQALLQSNAVVSGNWTCTGTCTGFGGTPSSITGSITTNQIAFGTASQVIGGSANLTWDGTKLVDILPIYLGSATAATVYKSQFAFAVGSDHLVATDNTVRSFTTQNSAPVVAAADFNAVTVEDLLINPAVDDPTHNVLTGRTIQVEVPSTNTKILSEVRALNINFVANGGTGNYNGTGLEVDSVFAVPTSNQHIGATVKTQQDVTITGQVYGLFDVVQIDQSAAVPQVYGSISSVLAYNTSHITTGYGFFADHFRQGSATIDNLYLYYAPALSTDATNAYHLWFDERGVYRIKADNAFNSVYQAIPALYNPQFTKYVAGATNFERCIPGCQWESNVATVTTEAGGTGTLRALNIGDASVQVKINSNNITLAAALTTAGANALTLTTTGVTNVTLPTTGTLVNSAVTTLSSLVSIGTITTGTWNGTTIAVANGGSGATTLTGLLVGNGTSAFTTVTAPAGTVVGTSDTQTLTNKRIDPRVTTAADATSITPNTDTADYTYQSNSQAGGTLTINADGGTPVNGRHWILKIKATNTQTFSFNAQYVGGTVALPTTTSTGGKIDYFAFIYDSVNSKWDYVGTAAGF